MKKKLNKILLYLTTNINNIEIKYFLKLNLSQYLFYLAVTLNLFIKIFYCVIKCKKLLTNI